MQPKYCAEPGPPPAAWVAWPGLNIPGELDHETGNRKHLASDRSVLHLRFIASFEPLPQAIYFRVGYAVIGLTCLAVAVALLARRK
jgi:hypothetical protein